MLSEAPYPGLRSFRREESDIFFGRDDHVDEMVEKLADAYFLCVTGPSGCGKSSLARTGLMNSLEAGFLPGRGSDWIFCDMRPGSKPLDRLMGTLAGAIAEGETAARGADSDRANEILKVLEHYFREVRLSNDLNDALATVDLRGRPILVLVDQFEELFRYGQADERAARQFVEILLQTANARRDVYIVITIRTDELEKCSRYAGLTRAINESQFLTPTLDRYQMQEAIEGPLALFGVAIDPRLSAWLLNSLEEELDKLPLLQHALKLLYAREITEAQTDSTLTLEDFIALFDFDPTISLSASDSRSALRGSLSHSLDQIYFALPEHQQALVARAFCALTDVESRGRDIRRPLKLGDLAQTIGASDINDARQIVSAFNPREESYLSVRGSGELSEDDTIDVTHECILRLWSRLQNKWLINERESAENVKVLAVLAKTWDESNEHSPAWRRRLFPTEVLSGYALTRYRNWFIDREPNAAWAKRYLNDVVWPASDGRARQFLSPEEIFAKIEALLASSLWQSRAGKNRKIGYATAAAILVFVVIPWLYLSYENAAKKQRLESFQRFATTSAAAASPVESVRSAVDALRESVRIGADSALINAIAGVTWQTIASTNELYRYFDGTGSESQMEAADFTPDGKSILTVDHAGVVREWAVGDPSHELRLLEIGALPDGKIDGGRSLEVSPAGDIAVVGFVSGSVFVVDLKDAATAPIALTIDGNKPHPRHVLEIAFTADGSMFATSSLGGNVIIWQSDGAGRWMKFDEVDWKTEYEKFPPWIDEDGGRPLALARQVWSVDPSDCWNSGRSSSFAPAFAVAATISKTLESASSAAFCAS